MVSRADVIAGVRTNLANAFARSDSGLEVTTVFQRHDLSLVDGKVEWRVDVDVDNMKPGRKSIPVNVLVDGVSATNINVKAVIKRFKEVPVALRSLKRGTLVTAKDIKWKRIEMVRTIDGLIVDDENVIGLAALRTVRKGTPLRQEWFDEPLAIERGERVRVKLVQGGLVINTTAVALGKGRVGDMIQLKNPKSHVRYEARVSAPGQALIQTW